MVKCLCLRTFVPGVPSISQTSKNSFLPKVALVGAGPGDPGLLTLRGAEWLARADVVLHDALANPSLLDHCQPEALLQSVGKHGAEKDDRHRIWSQSEIHDEIVRHVRNGKTVVRLKGGDPAVFARTAEELDCLVREQISFEVVPGITAALAASSYCGIPITHRDWASAAALVTGHGLAIDGGTEADESMDWQALARFPGTIVIYMGVTTAKRWSEALMAEGKSPATPVSLIRKCSLPDQSSIQCTLGDVAERLADPSKFRPPVVAVIGEVVRLGRRFDWFTRRPLFGKSILLTRPASKSLKWERILRDHGASVQNCPLVAIEKLSCFEKVDTAIASLKSRSWVFFSSQSSVEHIFHRLFEFGLDARAFWNSKIAAVGTTTADALRSFGITADLIADAPQNSVSMAQELLRVQELSDQVQPNSILCFQADRAANRHAEILEAAGWTVENVTAYQHQDVRDVSPLILEQVDSGVIDWVIVTSSIAAQNLVGSFGERLQNTRIASFSKSVTSQLMRLGVQPKLTSPNSRFEEILDGIIEFESRPERS